MADAPPVRDRLAGLQPPRSCWSTRYRHGWFPRSGSS